MEVETASLAYYTCSWVVWGPHIFMYNSASNTKFIVEHEARHVIVQCGVKSWFCLYYSGIQSTVVDRGVQLRCRTWGRNRVRSREEEINQGMRTSPLSRWRFFGGSNETLTNTDSIKAQPHLCLHWSASCQKKKRSQKKDDLAILVIWYFSHTLKQSGPFAHGSTW